jgi:hypothetical protein
MADTPEWQAQAAFARDAAPVAASDEPARTQRVATLRDFLVARYRTAKMAAR